MTRDADSGLGLPAMGELRASWREKHICIRCSHNIVCKMSAALDRNFLVAISQCLVFDPAERDADGGETESP